MDILNPSSTFIIYMSTRIIVISVLSQPKHKLPPIMCIRNLRGGLAYTIYQVPGDLLNWNQILKIVRDSRL